MKTKTLIAVILSAVSGVLLRWSFPDTGAPWLAWVALVPMLAGLLRFSQTRAAFALGLATGPAVFLILMVWGVPPGYEAMYALAAIFFLVLFLAGLATWKMFTVANGRWLAPAAILGIPALELLRQNSVITHFAAIGTTQVGAPMFAQIASLGGVFIVSLMLVAANCAIAIAIAGAPSVRMKRAGICAAIALALVCANIYLWKNPPAEKGRFKVAAVQFGYVPEAKNPPKHEIAFRKAAKAKHWRASTLEAIKLLEPLTIEAANKGARLIVWPECTLDVNPEKHPDINGRLSALAKKTGAYLVIGFGELFPGEDHKKFPASHNHAVVYAPDGTLIHRYVKQHRVTSLGVEKGPIGHKSDPIPTALGKMGLMICYDADYPDIARKYAANGAEFFIVPSHDLAAFLTKHHPWMAYFRSIEYRRALVKSDYVHGTFIADPRGRVLANPPDGLQMAMADIPVVDAKTPYPRLIGPLTMAIFALLGLVLVLAIGDSRRER